MNIFWFLTIKEKTHKHTGIKVQLILFFLFCWGFKNCYAGTVKMVSTKYETNAGNVFKTTYTRVPEPTTWGNVGKLFKKVEYPKNINFARFGYKFYLWINYNLDEEIIFPLYYRHDNVFQQDCLWLTDERKVLLLLRKLGPVEHAKYVNYILPKKPADIPFKETILLLEKYSVIKAHFSTSAGIVWIK